MPPHIEAVGIQEGHPFAHQVLGEAALIASLQIRELQAVIDAQDLLLPVRLTGGDGLAIRRRQGDDVRQVVLALGIVVSQSREPIFQLGSVGHQEAGVDFRDGEFGRAGVPGLDDRPHLAVIASHDAAIASGIGEGRGQDAQRRSGGRGDELP